MFQPRVKAGVFHGMHAASGAKVEAAPGKEIDHRKIFGNLHRVVHRKNGHRAAEAHPPGSRRGCSQKQLGVWQHAAKMSEMMLSGPERVETQLFGRIDLLKPVRVQFPAIAVQFGDVSVEDVISRISHL